MKRLWLDFARAVRDGSGSSHLISEACGTCGLIGRGIITMKNASCKPPEDATQMAFFTAG